MGAARSVASVPAPAGAAPTGDRPDPDVLAFVRGALPSPPARVLQVGAGRGELAAALRAAGYEVLAIDPATAAPGVAPLGLDELDVADGYFAAAIAVVSLHHVSPLAPACAELARAVRPGGRLVIDEFDVDRFDARGAGWWLAQQRALGRQPAEAKPEALVSALRGALHPVVRLRLELGYWFDLGRPVPGPYLYRWDLRAELRAAELALIGDGALPACGARLVGTRRAKPR